MLDYQNWFWGMPKLLPLRGAYSVSQLQPGTAMQRRVEPKAPSEGGWIGMSLIPKLAFRNLFHDRLRFFATLIGIVFSIELVTVQAGLYFGFGEMVTTMIDHASADLWIMPNGTKCFEDPSLLDDRKRFRIRVLDGVADAVPLVTGFADWRMPSGSSTPVFIVGSDLKSKGLLPWDIVAGRVDDLAQANSVVVDKTYLDRLGVSGVGATAEIRRQKVKVVALSNGIRSFTTTPFVFMSLDRARAFSGASADEATFILVRLEPHANIDKVRDQIRATVPDVEVLTAAEFANRSRSFWLFGTGAGSALLAGAILGLIVGTVVVAQTLYSSTKEHLIEFATLRAIGSSARYIYKVIILQALISAIVGFSLTAAIDLFIIHMTKSTALPIVINPPVMLALFGLTVIMCVGSALLAITQVTRIDPVVVFKQ
jgi:putative ABC transport system permease protein